jgi:tRNA G18 (ribose-2'-O)-methylase SpoU
VQYLKQNGYVVYAIEQCEGSTLLNEIEDEELRNKKLAIVLGNEVKGVQQQVVDQCDGCLEIPQYGTKHSMNVSVTAGIVIWELSKHLL